VADRDNDLDIEGPHLPSSTGWSMPVARPSRVAAEVGSTRLEATRQQVLAYRLAAGGLNHRLPPGPTSLHRAAWAGLQDSMPRAAVLSIHARVQGTEPSTWEDHSLVQLWGPRYSAYAVAAADRAVFTLGRLPTDAKSRHFAEAMADRLEAFLGGRSMGYGEAGHGMGVNPNALRYAAPTGRVLMRWDGARQPTIWTVPRPGVDPAAARLELARRHLRVFGPTTPAAFAAWAGVKPVAARAAFEALASSLVAVRTPIGDASILAADEPALRAAGAERPTKGPPAEARLLPSGDAYYLLQGEQRELLVPDAGRRALLWTSRVWPGALLVGSEIAGTWRRANALLTVEPWRPLTKTERDAVEAEAQSLPLPGVASVEVRWSA
jgi:hypothetical protein